ncbi:MAG TPA: hypothetical protein VF887_05350 [Gemmatimonadaceae bacterium]
MFIEMLDLLRCVNAHEETWLVASLKAVSNRIVLDATLGCPVCQAQYPIRKGIADFRRGGDLSHPPAVRRSGGERREELATRIGAFLNATEPGATIVLGGIWADAAQELAMMTDVRVLALNPGASVEESERVGLIRADTEIPLAPGSVLGLAFDATFSPETVSSALKVVRAGGRIVGPVSTDAPHDVSELARDASYWVAEKPAEMVSLRRSRLAE